MVSPPIRAYTLDAAMTLFRVAPSVGGIYAETAALYGVKVDAAQLDAAFTQAWRERKPVDAHTSEHEERQWWHGTVHRTFELVGATGKLDGQFEQFFEHLYGRFDEASAWEVYGDVFPALHRMRDAGAPIAIVSNFDSRLRALVRNLGLGAYVDAVVISAEAGVRKPDPGIFQMACTAIGATPAETCHIGDDPEEDYAGALASGMQARLLDRGAASSSSSGVISSLEALPL